MACPGSAHKDARSHIALHSLKLQCHFNVRVQRTQLRVASMHHIGHTASNHYTG